VKLISGNEYYLTPGGDDRFFTEKPSPPVAELRRMGMAATRSVGPPFGDRILGEGLE